MDFMLKNIFKRQSLGQSLFEVTVILGVVSIVLVALLSLSAYAIRNSSFSNNNALASKYAQEALEWIRQQRDENWNNISSRATPSPGNVYCLQSVSSWPDRVGECNSTQYISGTNLFRREATLIDVSGGVQSTKIDVVVEVKWRDAQGEHSARASTRFTNWNR